MPVMTRQWLIILILVISEAIATTFIGSSARRIHGSTFIEESDSPKRKRARLRSNDHSVGASKAEIKSDRSGLRDVPLTRSSAKSSPIPSHGLSPGIVNMGDTCYLSALLQVTSHIPAFTNLLSWILPQLDIPAESLPETLRPFHALLLSYMHLVDEISSNTTTSIVPRDIFEALRAALSDGDKYEIHVQQDAQEALSDLINALNDGVNAIKDFLKPSNTIPTDAIRSLFTINIINQKKCTVCSRIVAHNEPSIITWLSIPKPSSRNFVRSLEDLFHSTFSPELVEGVNCETCSRNNNAVGNMFIVDPAPPILIIGLLRFESTGRKISSKISLPILLDLSSISNSTGIYELTGLILHHGVRAQSGHYTSQFLEQKNRIWINANDSKMNLLPNGPDVTQSSDVYIMVYTGRRISNDGDNHHLNNL